MNLLDILFSVFLLATCFRLLFYRRGSSSFKVHYSFIAYIIVVLNGALGLGILTGLIRTTQLPSALLTVIYILAFAVLYCRGNVALLISLPGRIHHALNLR
ncbi:MAG: hypothetical protein OFPI_00250 [Osedax symbiont Rs2]|nr:MAG: hypothetical protein OFPI_00250 [Osedax symbiont Rs2]